MTKSRGIGRGRGNSEYVVVTPCLRCRTLTANLSRQCTRCLNTAANTSRQRTAEKYIKSLAR